ncbi:MAG: polysaccharide deacetylase family protein [Oscillospiraceae bacterium]|nr:polysaccharide deacetylase family protein [Oscillospiraceae bacterium]
MKKWLILLASVIVFLLLVLAGFNIFVDPFGVFGDEIYHWDSFSMTNNPKTAKIEYLENHKTEYDSFVIGASAASYDTKELNKYMNAHFYNLFCSNSSNKYYCDLADYLIRNYDVKNILLNVGISDASISKTERRTLNTQEHYRVRGHGAFLFYLQHAFCSPRLGFDKIKAAENDTYLPSSVNNYIPETGCYDMRVRDIEKITDLIVYEAKHQNDFDMEPENNTLDNIQESVEMVSYISELCAKNNVKLTIVFSPVSQTQWKEYDETELVDYKKQLAEVSDYWDFSYSSVSLDNRYFYDGQHFRNAVGTMVFARIFNDKSVYYPKDFGTYISSADTVSKPETVSADKNAYSVDVPIILYHNITLVKPKGSSITLAAFTAQIEALHNAGYNSVSFDQVISYVYNGGALPENPICITFDDGYLSNYELAYPVLEKYQMKATIFVIGASVGHKEFYKDTKFPITPHFSYEEARKMISSGLISIQSHTFDMHQWPPFEAAGNVRKDMSKFENESDEAFVSAIKQDFYMEAADLEMGTGEKINVVAYPAGIFSDLTEVTLHELGVEVTLSTNTDSKNTIIRGLPQSLNALCRYSIEEGVTADGLLTLLGQ